MQENGVYQHKFVLCLYEKPLEFDQVFTTFYDLNRQQQAEDFNFETIKNGKSFSTQSGTSVCVILNKLGNCLLVEVDKKSKLKSFKKFGPSPAVIDTQLTSRSKSLLIFATGEIYTYNDLSEFLGVVVTNPELYSK